MSSLYLSKHTRIFTLPIATSTSSLYTGWRGNNSEGHGNTTIRISRATRVSEQWNASLEREITDTDELRHLDEFLGNQVGYLSCTHVSLTHLVFTSGLGVSPIATAYCFIKNLSFVNTKEQTRNILVLYICLLVY